MTTEVKRPKHPGIYYGYSDRFILDDSDIHLLFISQEGYKDYLTINCTTARVGQLREILDNLGISYNVDMEEYDLTFTFPKGIPCLLYFADWGSSGNDIRLCEILPLESE